MFNVAFDFIKSQFLKVIYTMDNINVFGDFTVLDFNIAMLVFGAILPIVIVTVNNWSSNAIGNEERRASIARQKEYNRQANQRHNDLMNQLKK